MHPPREAHRARLARDRRWRSAAAVALAALVTTGVLVRASASPRANVPASITLSIVGTSDLHGYFIPRAGRGGIEVFAGYVNNLRAARASDGGAVLLVDAGDTFQGGVESDLSEGAVVVDAYNALGYAALAIGNHEFDFGPADRPGARQDFGTDPRGALKARAAQARFPFLAANLLDAATDRPVDWRNVHPSTLVDAAGVKVGIIGAMTVGALRATLPLNVQGLRMAPLAPAVEAEATRLRARGATVVIVTAHAGGGCDRFDNPDDLSSCDDTAEIFDLARALPAGLVDAIVAGHTHAGLAHRVNGVSIVQSYWGGRAFGRIDLTVDRATGRVRSAIPMPPQDICAAVDVATGRCAAADAPATRIALYEGRPVGADLAVVRAMAPALARVRQLQAMPLGVALDAALPRSGNPESPLGNLFADALRQRSGADVALNNNSLGGLRADLPGGPLTFGALYDTFPFDNRLARVTLTGARLELGIASALRRGRPGAFGISGARVVVSCAADDLRVRLFRPGGEPIGATERLVVVGMDSLLGGRMFQGALTDGSLHVALDAPVVREVVEDWLREQQGRELRADAFATGRPRLELDPANAVCLAH
jgi:5'-nucleotidase